MAEKTIKAKWFDEYCEVCEKNQINSWDRRLQKALGYDYDICEECMADEYGMEKQRFRDRMADYFGMKPCEGI